VVRDKVRVDQDEVRVVGPVDQVVREAPAVRVDLVGQGKDRLTIRRTSNQDRRCGTRILRVIPRAGRPCHSFKGQA